MASWPTDPAKADEALTPALRNELDLLRVDGRTQCPGPGCRVQADKNHFCVLCRRNVCLICRQRNADGSDNDNIRVFVVCSACEPGGGNDLSSSARTGNDSFMPIQAPALPPLPPVGSPRTVTPPVDQELPSHHWPEHSQETLEAAKGIIGGPGRHYSQNMNFLSRKVDFKQHKSMMQYAGLRPRNKQQCVKPPNHWLGVNSIEDAILNVCIFQKILTKDQQKAEKTKHINLSKRMKALLRRNVARLDTLRPAPLNSTDSVDDSGDIQQPQQPPPANNQRASLRQLVQVSSNTTRDPAMQARARANAGPVAHDLTGITSTRAEREELVRRRESQQRGRTERRKMGENARSLGEQQDALSNRAGYQFFRAGAKAIDTAFYPQRGPSEHKRGFIAMEYTTMQDPGAAGGRTKARKADKPRLTMAATDKDMALGMLKEAARQIRNMPSKKDVHFQCMFMKEGTSMVEQENERVAKWRQTLPTRNNYTDEHVQRNTINPHAVRNPDEPLPPSP